RLRRAVRPAAQQAVGARLTSTRPVNNPAMTQILPGIGSSTRLPFRRGAVNLSHEGRNHPEPDIRSQARHARPQRETLADPGHLSFGITPCVALAAFDGRLQARPAVEMIAETG